MEVLQYSFVVAHVAGAMITADDFVSRIERIEINPTENLEINHRNDKQTQRG